MAEIEIEKKKTIWPWILVALLILAVILYFWVYADDNDDLETNEEITTEQVMEEEMNDASDMNETADMAALQEYSSYIDNPDMGLDHEYANGAITELIDATRAVAESNNVNIDAELAEAQDKAQMITEDPMQLTHANKIKSSGETILAALQKVQSQKFPDLNEEYTAVEEALAKIKPDQPTLDQKDAVKSFFEKAEELLNSMK